MNASTAVRIEATTDFKSWFVSLSLANNYSDLKLAAFRSSFE